MSLTYNRHSMRVCCKIIRRLHLSTLARQTLHSSDPISLCIQSIYKTRPGVTCKWTFTRSTFLRATAGTAKRVLAILILSVRLSVRHYPVPNQAQVR